MPILTPVRGRLFVALLALAAALLLAAGCSNDSGGDKTPAAGQTPATGQTPAAGQTPSGGATAEIKMVAGTAFDKDELRIPAGTDATISVQNTNGFHSFYVYASEADAQSGAEPVAEARHHVEEGVALRVRRIREQEPGRIGLDARSGVHDRARELDRWAAVRPVQTDLCPAHRQVEFGVDRQRQLFRWASQ